MPCQSSPISDHTEGLVKTEVTSNVGYQKNLDTVRNCQDLADLGMTNSGIYQLDPDGQDIGAGAISVRCDFSDNSTEIVHDQSLEMIFDGNCV